MDTQDTNFTIPEELDKIVAELKKVKITPEQLEQLGKEIQKEFDIPETIIVAGLAGVGKTSTVNALFFGDNPEKGWKVGVGRRGTEGAQEMLYEEKNGFRKLRIIDLPGLGDSTKDDEGIKSIYKEYIPQADIVLYIVQADDRAVAEVQKPLRDILLPLLKDPKKIVIGLNKVDLLGDNKADNLHWNTDYNLPSEEQQKYIDRKTHDMARSIALATGIKLLWLNRKRIDESRIIPYSALKRYNLALLIRIVCEAAGEKSFKIPVNPADPDELMSEEARRVVAEYEAEHNMCNPDGE